MSAIELQCEGWRRYGGAFTLGPPRWEQCLEKATVMLSVKVDDKVKEMPSCSTCWQEAIDTNIPLFGVRPLARSDVPEGETVSLQLGKNPNK